MSRRKKSNFSRKRAVISEINVTPFVDVLLIMLIVFMVTAPMLNLGFDVNLPQSTKNEVSDEQAKKVTLGVNIDGQIIYNNKKINIKTLKAQIQGFDKQQTQFFIQADKTVTYQNVISLMSVLNEMGFKSISLITEQPN